MDRPVRVLQLLDDLRRGGGERLVLDIVSRSEIARHSVWTAGGPTELWRAFADRGVEPMVGRGTALNRLTQLVSLVDAEGIDLIHAHTPRAKRFARALAAVTRTPLVLHLHAMHSNAGRKPSARRFARSALDVAQARAEHATIRPSFVACSELVAASHRPYVGGPVHVADNGVDVASIAVRADNALRERVLTELGVDTAGPVLLCVSRLAQSKGVDLLVPAMRRIVGRHPEAVLLVAGDGPLRTSLDNEAAAAGLSHSVRSLGGRDDVPELLGASDALVFPSTREGFGLVAAEAMAAGRPVVGMRVAPVDGIVDHGRTGFLAPPDDPDGLARAVIDLLDDPARARAMGARARAVALERFDVRQTVRTVEALYSSIVAPYPAAARRLVPVA